MQLLHVYLLIAMVFIAIVTFLMKSMEMQMKTQPSFRRIFSLRSPWDGVPEFVLYLRLTSNPRFEQEYKNYLVRTMKLFFPPERAKLVVVLDNEKKKDHLLWDKIKTEWPYPQICYRDPSSINAYRGWGKARMFWDMMYPDKCTNVSYVGYVDTDTFFSTLVTPQLLFDNGKPIIIAKIGQVPIKCWAKTTELFLGKKEVMQCMSTFPVMIKTEHMIKMREFIARKHGADFDSVFKNPPPSNQMDCLCQFSIMCNYLWYFHRNDYSWRLQNVSNFLCSKQIKRSKTQPSFRRIFPLRNPWDGVPEFVLYLRLTSSPRFEQEYKNNLVRTMKLFFPPERAKLLVVLDNEKKEDQLFGDRIKSEWPYPQICYRDPSSIDAYRGWGKARMFWDMMYPDKCTNVSYVGYVDTDAFFSTLVTPQLLFDNGKPIIIAKIGQVLYECWAETTELFLGKKEVMQCMSTFPVMIKTEHMLKMREVIARNHSMDFDSVFKNTPGKMECLCQFSIMCNYVWYYHRNEYSWRLQMVPNGDWRGENLFASQVSPDYYRTNVPPEMTIPMPRSSIHLRYTITNGQYYNSKTPPKKNIEYFIKVGLCYSAGFDVCPENCKRLIQAKIHFNLYSFEFYQWFWDKRCKKEQDKHYKNVRELVRYYVFSKMEVFGLSSLDKLCSLI